MTEPWCTFSAPADELARVFSNVSLVAKKSVQYPTIRFEFGADGKLTVVGTDGYCAAEDHCAGKYVGPLSGAVAEIPRDSLDALEKAARPNKKDDVRLYFYRTDGVVLDSPAGKESAHLHAESPRVWAQVAELLALKSAGPFELPDLAAVDMRLLARFWRVKSSTGTHVADLMFTGAEAPILIKMGATFRALVMPIKREKHAESFPDGLW